MDEAQEYINIGQNNQKYYENISLLGKEEYSWSWAHAHPYYIWGWSYKNKDGIENDLFHYNDEVYGAANISITFKYYLSYVEVN